MHLDDVLSDPLWVSVLQQGLLWGHVDPQLRFIFVNFRHGPAVRQGDSECEALWQLPWHDTGKAVQQSVATKTGSQLGITARSKSASSSDN